MTTGMTDVPENQIAAVIILAAGQGTRMRSALPKVLHPIAGKPLLWHALRAAQGLRPATTAVVLGHGRDQVTTFLEADPAIDPVTIAVQDQQLGTGHAVTCALTELGALTGTVIVTYGDVPLLRTSTLARLVDQHRTEGNSATVLTAVVSDPHGYGRILRGPDGAVSAIVEQRDCDEDQQQICEINSGVYAFDAQVLASTLPRAGTANSQGEQYLTDVLAIARADGGRIGSVTAEDPMETEGVNDRIQLAAMARRLNDDIVRNHQRAGVTILDGATTWIHSDVTIGADTVIHPGTYLEAGTSIGSGATIGPDTTLRQCEVADGAVVLKSHCEGASIGTNASVGPFSYLRPGAQLAEGAKVGAYVEIKKSQIGPGAKVPHLSYVGDAEVGPGTNFSAGAITANYDGVTKHPTVIGANAFIGTNTTLIAPVHIAPGAYTAAGSAVTDDVQPGDLAVARGRQHNSAGWVQRKRAGTASDQAAQAARDDH